MIIESEIIKGIFERLDSFLLEADKHVLAFSEDPSDSNAKLWAWLQSNIIDYNSDTFLIKLASDLDFDYEYGKDELVFHIIDLYQKYIKDILIEKRKKNIYVASSWRNDYYPEVVEKLREAGHEVYDFRNPPSGDPGFKWSSVSEDYMEWTPQQYRDMLQHPKAERQFHNDIEAMEACDTCVLVLPCGRSAHTEAGWFAGRGKLTIAYIPERQEPELMYKLFNCVCCSIEEILETLK